MTKKGILSLGCAALLLSAATGASAISLPCVVTNTYGGVKCVVNYDESRVAPYDLENPLKFSDGVLCHEDGTPFFENI